MMTPPSVFKGEHKYNGHSKKDHKMEHQLVRALTSGIVLSSLFVGCATSPSTPCEHKITSPYEYKAEKSDADSVNDPFVKSGEVPRLKVSIRAKGNQTSVKKDVGAIVCGKLKGRIAESDFFEVANRDDLANIKVEGELSGKKWNDDVPPSELLLLVEAGVVNYLGGATQDDRERLQKYYEACMKKKLYQEAIKTQNKLKAANQTSVEDPAVAFGVEIKVSCSAYDVETMRQYVAINRTISEISDTKGRIDVALDRAAEKVAADVINSFAKKVAPAMKTDCLVIETRGGGKVVKVDVSDLRRTLVGGERAVVYTHTKIGKKDGCRRELAEGTVGVVEDGCVWVEIKQLKGYGDVHVGHCVDFSEVHVK